MSNENNLIYELSFLLFSLAINGSPRLETSFYFYIFLLYFLALLKIYLKCPISFSLIYD